MKYEKAAAEIIDFGESFPFILSSTEGNYSDMSAFVHAHSTGGVCSGFGNTGDASLFSCPPFFGTGTYTIVVNGQKLTVTFRAAEEGYSFTCSAYYGGGIPY